MRDTTNSRVDSNSEFHLILVNFGSFELNTAHIKLEKYMEFCVNWKIYGILFHGNSVKTPNAPHFLLFSYSKFFSKKAVQSPKFFWSYLLYGLFTGSCCKTSPVQTPQVPTSEESQEDSSQNRAENGRGHFSILFLFSGGNVKILTSSTTLSTHTVHHSICMSTTKLFCVLLVNRRKLYFIWSNGRCFVINGMTLWN